MFILDITALLSSFDERQRLALREVEQDRFLIETDSPYFPNTPAFMGDVAFEGIQNIGSRCIRGIIYNQE